LPRLIAQYCERYPDVNIDVIFTDEIIDPAKSKLDFSIRGAFPQSSDLIGFALWSYSRYLYASPDYLERNGMPDSIEALGVAFADPAYGATDSQGVEFSQ
jgi:DNA-binding transcriptional LysR family regulator